MKATLQDKILIVDDDEIILVAIKETLTPEGYEIATANNPLTALKLLREQTFSTIVSDQRMAEMTGLEFFAEAKKICPDSTRILITGVLTLKTVIDAVNKGEIFRFLAKPWIREELLATVRNAVQRYQLVRTNRKLQDDTLKLNSQLANANAELSRKLDELLKQKEELDVARQAMEENFDHSLQLCFQLISSFHPMLGKETKAIVDLCRSMAENSELNKDEQHVLVVSAWLQNIGLIGVSRELLTRSRDPNQDLTDEEKALIRNHPVYGQTLASFVDRLRTVGETIRASHERWDGRGFPDGLAAEMIPRPARYLALAVFYVECGLSREEAIEEIVHQSGKGFEPEVVRVFLKVTRLVKLPKKVKEILFSELQPGMVLAKGIYSPSGLLLIPEGHILNDLTMKKIREHNQADRIPSRLLVYS